MRSTIVLGLLLASCGGDEPSGAESSAASICAMAEACEATLVGGQVIVDDG